MSQGQLQNIVERAIDRLWRRIWMVIGRGVINAINSAGGLATVQITLSGAETRDNTPLVQHYGFASAPLPGCQGIGVFIGGDRSEGAVIATNDLRYRISLVNGEVAIHDDQGQHVHLRRDGIHLSSPKSITRSVNGYGEKISWNGSGWVIDSYTDTTNVTTNLHAPNPPEIP